MNLQNNQQNTSQSGRSPVKAPNGNQMNALLGMAGKQLGKDPQKLKAQLEGGQVNQILSGIDPKKAAQINNLLNNPQQMEQFLNSPQVKGLLNTLMGQK